MSCFVQGIIFEILYEKNDYCNGLGPDKIRKSNVDNTTNDEKG